MDEFNADELRTSLEAACDDLWWSSESDYPVEVVWESVALADRSIEQSVVRELFDHAEDTEIEIVDVEDFFERATAIKSWHTDEDEVQIARLRSLKTLLTDSLTHLQVYRCGAVEIKVYVLGNAPNNIIAGVKTILIET